MYFDWCDMVVMTVDDRVVDWDLTGNQCFLNVADDVEPEEAPERVNPLEQYQVVSETTDDETHADDGKPGASMNPYAIGPDDNSDSLF